jgi:hypothetical protein
VCNLVATGRLNKQIATVLGTREKTIKVHRARMMRKMRVTSVAELVRAVDRLARASDSTNYALGHTDYRDAPSPDGRPIPSRSSE